MKVKNTDALHLIQAITKQLMIAMETVDYQPNELVLRFRASKDDASLEVSCDDVGVQYNPNELQLSNHYDNLELEYSLEGLKHKLGTVPVCETSL